MRTSVWICKYIPFCTLVRTYAAKCVYSSLCFLEWVVILPHLLPAVLRFHGQLQDGFDSLEAAHPPPGGIDGIVGVFQVIFLLIGHQEVADRARLQGGQGVFIAPDGINPVQLLGIDVLD